MSMPHYILLLNWTDQGIRNVKDTAKRAAAARKAFERAGAKPQIFYTFGQYDIVGIAEAPNDEVLLRLALATASLGNVRTTTLKAWTEAEAAKVIAKLP